jgi:hypothetical protein
LIPLNLKKENKKTNLFSAIFITDYRVKISIEPFGIKDFEQFENKILQMTIIIFCLLKTL